MKYILIGLVSLLVTVPAQAMTWQELEAEIRSVESGQPGNRDLIIRFSEIVEMLVTYYKAVQQVDPDSQLFCLPAQSSMQLDEAVSLVRAQARQSAAADETLVQSLLLAGFRAEFPCR